MKTAFLHHTLLLAALGFCLVFSGCQPKIKMAPVSGMVTLDGEPLKGAVVTFNPSEGSEPGPGSGAKTDEQGRFNLSLAVPGKDVFAAVVGRHDVIIQTYSEDGNRRAMEVKTTFDVPAKGTDRADFALPLN